MLNKSKKMRNEEEIKRIISTLLLKLTSLQQDLAHNFELDEQRAVARKQISSFYVGADKILRLDRL